jgi:hypothetical protein
MAFGILYHKLIQKSLNPDETTSASIVSLDWHHNSKPNFSTDKFKRTPLPALNS